MRYGQGNVITGLGIVMWDGVTRPEEKDDGKGGKRQQWSLKVALLASAPEIAELTAIATEALQGDAKFKGQLPPGGVWPIMQVNPADFEGKLPSHVAFNAKSFRIPQVFGIDNKELPPIAYQNMLYPGATVRVVIHAYAFDNKSKGIAFGLDGVQIIDATTPRLPVGGVDASAAFAAAGGQAAPPVAPVAPPVYTPPPAAPVAPAPPAAPVAPAPDFLNPPVAPPKRMVTAPTGQQFEYDVLIAGGWTDASLTANGYRL